MQKVSQAEPTSNKKNPKNMNAVLLSGTLESVKPIPRKEEGAVGCRFLIRLLEPHPNTFSCTAWDQAARTILKLSEGAEIRISGRLRRASWVDKQTGLTRRETEVVAETVEVIQ